MSGFGKLFLFYLWSLALLLCFCELINFHKMKEVCVINVVFSVLNSTIREGSNAGGMRTCPWGEKKEMPHIIPPRIKVCVLTVGSFIGKKQGRT